MIAPTHIAYATLFGTILGIDNNDIIYVVLGSILPDIDHPRAFLGRLFFFISIPLHKKFSHRKEIHGYPLWFVITALGYFYTPLLYIGLGAISHVYLDCHNVAGVAALRPFSDKVFVNFKYDWRVLSGSSKDILLFILFAGLAFTGLYVNKIGGVSAAIGDLIESYDIAYERYI
ncbi:MAG: metal-dependent hydrolase, partial [Desulfobacterales bacterium]|nr:metal-dependent hydrolase [Desulfobacterales bacterium]